MENQIKYRCLNIFDVNKEKIKVVSRLLGGMSNFTYIIEVNEKKYTYRIPGKNAEKFVDRREEISNIHRISNLGLNNNTLYLDINHGYKVANYVEGKPLSELEVEDYLERVKELLKKLHNSSIKAKKDYNPIERLENYERLVVDLGYSHDEKYFGLKAKFLEEWDFLNSVKKVFCHNDSQPSNFVIGEKDYLLDWEFGGNNDPMYDIACFGNMDFKNALALLPVYLEKEPNKEEIKRVYLWRIFQCLQWHNVAMYKDAIGLSQELKVDFDFVAKQYLIKVENLFENLEKEVLD